MSEEIAEAFEDAAKKAEQGLSHDFADAYHNILKDTETKSTQVADNAATNEADTVDNLTKAGDRPANAEQPTSGNETTAPGQNAGTGEGTSGLPDGPPWQVADGVIGTARGKALRPPNNRHFLSGVKSGEVKDPSSVVLRGYESEVRQDIPQIAAGRATYDADIDRYRINGRSYGVESSGTVFPDSGVGIAKLDRNAYAALKEIAKAGGDESKLRVLSMNPRFANNPQAVADAWAVYNGTYQ